MRFALLALSAVAVTVCMVVLGLWLLPLLGLGPEAARIAAMGVAGGVIGGLYLLIMRPRRR